MPSKIVFIAVTCLLACVLLGTVAFAAPSTETRFTASYSVRVSVNTTSTTKSSDWAHLAKLLPGVITSGEASPIALPTATIEEYAYSTTGTADIDTQNSVFRFNVTYLTYKKGDKQVSNTKPRATILLMYDVLSTPYTSDTLYRYGTNFTWASPTCTCGPISPENGGGNPPLLYLPPLAVSKGNTTITVNKRVLTSALYTYEGESYTTSSDNNVTTPLAISYSYYVSTSTVTSNFLDRVTYGFKLPSGASVSVEYDFWGRDVMHYSSEIAPDVSCKATCYAPSKMSARALPTSLYPKTCETSDTCVCVNQSLIAAPANVTADPLFCSGIPWAVSSTLDVPASDNYAWLLKNLTVSNQAVPLLPECATQMTNFICSFYLPPCTRHATRFRPSIRGFLSCFSENDLYYNSDPVNLFKQRMMDLWQHYYGYEMPQWDFEEFEVSHIASEREAEEYTDYLGPIADPILPSALTPPTDAPVAATEPISAPTLTTPTQVTIPALMEPTTPESKTPDSIVEPAVILEPEYAPQGSSEPVTAPEFAPISSVPQAISPIAPPATPSTPSRVPETPITPPTGPVAPIVMTNASIAYATSFATFSSYNIASGKSFVAYPDIYTLKNWQIALMLFGSIGLLLTIIISCVMVNRGVANHYEKV